MKFFLTAFYSIALIANISTAAEFVDDKATAAKEGNDYWDRLLRFRKNYDISVTPRPTPRPTPPPAPAPTPAPVPGQCLVKVRIFSRTNHSHGYF